MTKTKCNEEIRKKIADAGFMQYQLAYAMGVSKYTLNSWLQIPLTEERKKKILDAINQNTTKE